MVVTFYIFKKIQREGYKIHLISVLVKKVKPRLNIVFGEFIITVQKGYVLAGGNLQRRIPGGTQTLVLLLYINDVVGIALCIFSAYFITAVGASVVYQYQFDALFKAAGLVYNAVYCLCKVILHIPYRDYNTYFIHILSSGKVIPILTCPACRNDSCNRYCVPPRSTFRNGRFPPASFLPSENWLS